MIDVKEAIARAREYAVKLLEIKPGETLLEEAVPSDTYWQITLSFNPRRVEGRFSQDMQPVGGAREFKTFRVNKTTGEIEGMFIAQAV